LYPYPLSGATSFVFADPVNGNMAVPVTSRSGKNAHTQMFKYSVSFFNPLKIEKNERLIG
ncbi:MAG: hypothetical protein LBR36_01760, partial [Bacteroidales bacterium]|jgi:hypothetical protein|nr:hypothetical protein [Bacteroidales bacterium]